jgi:hypothetical protein
MTRPDSKKMKEQKESGFFTPFLMSDADPIRCPQEVGKRRRDRQPTVQALRSELPSDSKASQRHPRITISELSGSVKV